MLCNIVCCSPPLLVVLVTLNLMVKRVVGQEVTREVVVRTSLDDSISHTDYLITIYSSTPQKPCLYFSEKRFSTADSSLINCTWYKSNACCKRTEVASVFLNMFTLYKATPACMNMMNYLMCYFCSPDQYIWYRKSQVVVCAKFCDDIHAECNMAEYDGRQIGRVYKTGRAFCEAQDFLISEKNHQCFDFDTKAFSRADLPISSLSLHTLLSLLSLARVLYRSEFAFE